MKSSLRLAVLTCASFVGFALAAPALAAYTPSLTMEQSSYKPGAAITADVFIFAPSTDDPTAKLTIFSPRRLQRQADGGARHQDRARRGDREAERPGCGPVPARRQRPRREPGRSGHPGGRGALHARCHQPGDLGAEREPPGPDDLDPGVREQGGARSSPSRSASRRPMSRWARRAGRRSVPSSSRPTSRSRACSPTRPAGSTSGPGSSRRTRRNVGVPNAAGTVEWRTYVGLPSTLTLAKAKTKKGVKLVGKLAVNGLSPRGIRIALYTGRKGQPAPNAVSGGSGKRAARTGKLPTSGKYSLSRPSVKFATFFQARFENYATPCTGASPTGLTLKCIGEDIAAVTSNQVKATKPRKR